MSSILTCSPVPYLSVHVRHISDLQPYILATVSLPDSAVGIGGWMGHLKLNTHIHTKQALLTVHPSWRRLGVRTGKAFEYTTARTALMRRITVSEAHLMKHGVKQTYRIMGPGAQLVNLRV